MAVIPNGVYSETKKQTIGTMSTCRTQTIIDYYQCTLEDEQIISVQILDIYGAVMVVDVEKIPLLDFLKRFTYEPNKFKNLRNAENKAVNKAIATAERHVARKEYNSGEYEYGKALKLDRENLRANFGLGKLYMETGETDKAINIFTGLSRQNNVMEQENKHFFNELGIELRTLALYEQAVEFYQKALEVAPNDENLLFNIARAFMENGNKEEAHNFLDQALSINPQLEIAIKCKACLG